MPGAALGAYRHFVFDLDGTLVDSGRDLAAAVNRALRDLGLAELPDERVIGFVGHGMRRLLIASLAAAAPGREDELVDAASERFRDHYGRGLLDHTSLHRGVDSLLEALSRSGKRLSVLTNKPRVFTDPILRGLAVADRFADAVCGDEVTRPKPDPEGLLRLVERSGVPASETCLVGDSAVDVETARRARVAACAVTWGLRDVDELREADPEHLVSSPSEILGTRVVPPASRVVDGGPARAATLAGPGAPGSRHRRRT
ncbi:MAG: HAD family hydrolase [Alphaproteobacteria bacterium]